MSTAPVHSPEERWRRTVDQRGRPLKLKVGRLLKEFGHAGLQPGVGAEIETRLAQVGLRVSPGLRNATADQVITLEFTGDAPAPLPVGPPAPTAQRVLPVAPEQPFIAPETVVTPRPAPAPLPHDADGGERPAPVAGIGDTVGDGAALGEIEQSVLVRAAVEAERRLRKATDRTAAAAADRIASLERELTTERDATARARDDRDDLVRRMHVERREAAARMQALAAAERTARGLLEAQRTELKNLGQTVRVSTAAIAQTRETLQGVHGQVQQTAVDVRGALAESVLADEPESAPRKVPTGPAATTPAPPPATKVHTFSPLTKVSAPQPAVRTAPPADEVSERPATPAAPTTPAAPERPAAPAAPVVPERPAVPAEAHEEQGPAQGRRGRGRSDRGRRRTQIACAVCGRAGKTREPTKLIDAGWRVVGDVALCLTCLADDWQLAEGDSAPSRPRA